MTLYATAYCDCPDVITGTGQKRPDFCADHRNRYFTEAQLGRVGVGAVDSSAPRSRSKSNSGNGFAASKEQQAKVKGLPCVVCGCDEYEAGIEIDAAHVTPRRLAPHCDCPKGVVPLCREHHEAYDQLGGGFDLLPHLMSHGMYEETVHGFLEHGVSLREVMDTVTGLKWEPVELEASIHA